MLRLVLCLAPLIVVLAAAPRPLAARLDTTGEDALCDRAAATAARDSGVPIEVLRAIALTETGRRQGQETRPWPWTVNMEGKGHWFPTQSAALDYVLREQARGARSFDIGCFQINHLWHGRAFPSVEAMFDPLTNARYAARFLSDLHAETGDWSRAAGAYHSRTPERASRYAARFDRFRAALVGMPDPDPEEAESIALAPQSIEPPPGRTRRGTGPARALFALAETPPEAGPAQGVASLVALPGPPTGRFIDLYREVGP